MKMRPPLMCLANRFSACVAQWQCSAGVAQLGERWSCKPQVAGSIPVLSFMATPWRWLLIATGVIGTWVKMVDTRFRDLVGRRYLRGSSPNREGDAPGLPNRRNLRMSPFSGMWWKWHTRQVCENDVCFLYFDVT